MKRRLAGIVFVVASIAVAIVFIYIATERQLSTLENVLLQFITLAFGLVGSYILALESAEEAARDLIKPHARSAFRRVLALYGGLSRLAVVIESSRPPDGGHTVSSVVLDRLDSMVREQIVTSNDALEDWRDIIPEDVEQIMARIQAKKSAENRNG